MPDKKFMDEFLETHNAYREKHNAPGLTYNSELNTAAQKWADHLMSTKQFEHSETDDGENIYTMYGSGDLELTGKEAVDDWYSEIKDYDWSSPGLDDSTGHFTQVVWKGTTELGVGMATDGTSCYVVGQYRPSGNIPGDAEDNVLQAAGRNAGGADKNNSTGGGVRPKKACTIL